MDKRALTEQLLGLPSGSLLEFKDYGDHVVVIMPDGRKVTLGQSRLDDFALSQASTPASPEIPDDKSKALPASSPGTPRSAGRSRSRRPRRSFSSGTSSRGS